MIHALKTEPTFFDAVINNKKTFEARLNDRDFRVGDYLALNELGDAREGYTGRSVLLRITYILEDERFCKKGFAIMGFVRCGVQIDNTADRAPEAVLFGGCRN